MKNFLRVVFLRLIRKFESTQTELWVQSSNSSKLILLQFIDDAHREILYIFAENSINIFEIPLSSSVSTWYVKRWKKQDVWSKIRNSIDSNWNSRMPAHEFIAFTIKNSVQIFSSELNFYWKWKLHWVLNAILVMFLRNYWEKIYFILKIFSWI